MKKNKAFSLLEIVVAIAIFSIFLGMVISLFKSFDKERKISLEKSNIDQKIDIFEKRLRDIINSSDLEIPSTPNMGVDFINSNFSIVKPSGFPTSIIVPAIYDASSNYLISISNNGNNLSLNRVRASGNGIFFESVSLQGLNILVFRVLQQNRSYFWYWTLNGNPNFVNNLDPITFKDSVLYRGASYVVALKFFRPLARNNEIIYQTHGNNLNPGVGGSNNLYDPSILNVDISVNLYDSYNIRKFSYKRTLGFTVKYRTVI